MATDEAFQTAFDPRGQTLTRAAKTNTPKSGSSCGSISGISGAIGRKAKDAADAISHNETRHFIVQDSAGGVFKVGLAGLEPAT